MTQHELVISYIKEFGKIIPAKMGGKIYKGFIIGSQVDKRCRELRSGWKRKDGTFYPLLDSKRDGKFECFFLAEKGEAMYQITDTTSPGKPEPVLVEQQKMFADQPIRLKNFHEYE